MAFVPAAAGSFRAQTWGCACAGRTPNTSLPPGMGSTLEISCQVHRVPEVVSGKTEALPATQRTARFPVDHTSQQFSHPRRD